MNILDLLKIAIKKGSSDVHLTVGRCPTARVSGKFIQLSEEILTQEEVKAMVQQITTEKNFNKIKEEGECDFSISLETGERFRVNAYKQKGNYAIALRAITSNIPDFDTLGLPLVLKNFTNKHKGLVLVTGPTGSGKSTTLASIIDIINTNRQSHIITIEDPIEYVHQHKNSIVNQRERATDTNVKESTGIDG